MSTPLRLLLVLLGAAALFATAFAVGSAAIPDDAAQRWQARAARSSHGAHDPGGDPADQAPDGPAQQAHTRWQVAFEGQLTAHTPAEVRATITAPADLAGAPAQDGAGSPPVVSHLVALRADDLTEVTVTALGVEVHPGPDGSSAATHRFTVAPTAPGPLQLHLHLLVPGPQPELRTASFAVDVEAGDGAGPEAAAPVGASRTPSAPTPGGAP